MSGIDLNQFRDHIVVPALGAIGFYSEAAERLVIATALAESGLRYIQQIGGGPARGLFQMELQIHDDIWEHYLRRKPDILRDLKGLLIRDMDLHEQLHGNLFYAAAMCRIHYLRVKAPLPAADDIEGMARYWKEYYNTPLGAGTVDGFIQKAYRVMGL